MLASEKIILQVEFCLTTLTWIFFKMYWNRSFKRLGKFWLKATVFTKSFWCYLFEIVRRLYGVFWIIFDGVTLPRTRIPTSKPRHSFSCELIILRKPTNGWSGRTVNFCKLTKSPVPYRPVWPTWLVSDPFVWRNRIYQQIV